MAIPVSDLRFFVEWKEVIMIAVSEVSEYKKDGWNLIGIAKPYGMDVTPFGWDDRS